MKNVLTKAVLLFITLSFLGSCNNFFDINQNPNSAGEGTLTLMLPGSQISMAAGLNGALNNHAGVFVQHFYSLTPSAYALVNANYNASWSNLYAGALKNMDNIIADALESQLSFAAVSKLQKAFIYVNLVDMFGSVPFSQALQGQSNLSPALETGPEIYDALFDLIDEALDDLRTIQETPTAYQSLEGIDLIYDGNIANWIKMGNSLKIKMFNQMRLVNSSVAANGIQNILDNLATNGGIISTNAEDFQFKYGNSQTPNDRHPLYNNEYGPGKTWYMSNYLIYRLWNDPYSIADPRMRYYLYKQTNTNVAGTTDEPCDAIPCYFGYANFGNNNRWIGRDHGDPSGLPNDNALRSTFGVYPVGGRYDNNAHVAVANNQGGEGAGILPMLTNFMMKFTLAEAALTLGVTVPGETTQTLFEKGMRASFDKVRTLGVELQGTVTGFPTADAHNTSVTTYVTDWVGQYTGATSDAQRLETIITQKWLACFGNGIESWIDHRRTGYPLFPVQNGVATYNPVNPWPPTPAVVYPSNEGAIDRQGPFPRRFFYPQNEISTNSSITAEPGVTQPIFWDNN